MFAYVMVCWYIHIQISDVMVYWYAHMQTPDVIFPHEG